jgi:phosphoenolpyruvate carboxylase
MSTPEDILSIETSRITNYLTDQLIEGLVDDADLRSPLRELRSTIWPLDAAERPDSHAARLGKVNEKSRKIDPGKYQEIIDSVPEARRGAFMEHVAQMGHLRQLASLVARDNFFQQRFSDKGEAVVGSGEEFINNSNGDVSELLNSINGVTFNPVFTAHPTNNNALTSMKALGDVGRAITSFRSNPEAGDDSVKDAVAAYAKVAITPEENGHDRNLTAAEETQNMLHFMGEI